MKHGHSSRSGKSPTYTVWRSMMQRCYRAKDKNYPYYGGRGITVSPEWHKFQVFLTDMGETPAALTLDRKNNNENYCKDNCKWSTRTEQVRNRRNTHRLSFGGETKSLAEWAELAGVSFKCLQRRLLLKWPIEKALTTPTLNIKQVSALGNMARYTQKASAP